MRALIVATILALPATGQADDPVAEAKAHVERASTLHKEGQQREALAELKTAYALDPQAPLLFAMGQMHVQLGECTQAINYYQRFLATKPAAQQASITNEAIEACRTNPPVVDPVPEPPADSPPLEPPHAAPAIGVAARVEPSPWYADTLGLALVGGGVASGIAGIVLWRGAIAERDAADRAATYDAYTAGIERAQTKQTVGLVLGIAGVALAGAGGVHVWLRQREQAVTVVPTTGGAALSWSGRW